MLFFAAKITENYEYDYSYNYEAERKEEEDFPRSAIEWFDARTRRRRDTESSQNSEKIVYNVCVRSGKLAILFHCISEAQWNYIPNACRH